MFIIFKKNQLMFLLIVAMFMLALLQPNFAFAQAGDLNHSPISRGLCNVFELAGGNIGKAVAIFAIVAVGFGFFTGKFSIALVIGITLGIGILFGAPKIISALTGTDAVDCSEVNSGEAEQCDGAFGIAAVSSYPLDATNLMDITAPSSVPLSKRKVNFENLFSVECKTISGTKQWILTDIIRTPSESPIISGVTFSIFANNTTATGALPTATQSQTITINPTKICPKLQAKLFVTPSSKCSDISFGGVAGASKLSTAGTVAGGTAYDICVTGNDGSASAAIKVLGVTTTTSLYNNNSLIAATDSLYNLTINKFGLIGDAVLVTTNGVTFTATCKTGAGSGYWDIAASGTVIAATALASLSLQ